VHGDLEVSVKERTPSIVWVAPCHPPVLSRSDAVQAESWEVEVEGVVATGSLVETEQAAKTSPLTMHDKMMSRRATS
jgi:hypothetical protein